MITPDTVVVATKEQVSSNLAGEIVILNLANSVYYGLDPVGVDIWEQIQQPQRVSVVRDYILEHYDVAKEQCERDLLNLLEDMAQQGLIEISVLTGA